MTSVLVSIWSILFHYCRVTVHQRPVFARSGLIGIANYSEETCLNESGTLDKRLQLSGYGICSRNQHGTSLTTSYAERGNASLSLTFTQDMEQMQNNAGAAGSHGMAKAYGTSVNVEPILINCTQRIRTVKWVEQ